MLLSGIGRARKINRDFMSEMISETYRAESIAATSRIAHFVKRMARPGDIVGGVICAKLRNRR